MLKLWNFTTETHETQTWESHGGQTLVETPLNKPPPVRDGEVYNTEQLVSELIHRLCSAAAQGGGE